MIKFGYAQFIVKNIQLQLNNFTTLNYFRYRSYLVHLFLFHNGREFQCMEFDNVDEYGKVKSVVHWTPMIRKHGEDESFL